MTLKQEKFIAAVHGRFSLIKIQAPWMSLKAPILLARFEVAIDLEHAEALLKRWGDPKFRKTG
jgi:hypothetical protein